ncbi:MULTISPECIES: UbiA family prenyltransferase [unclassified Methanoculleus]|jgi:4-hydroxybenzoate polyprenyltransferase|uniref:UbiA family prenyltransferase n=2 Tax=unclassified Methanoculleus TaxID=2619537 RepID=UPI0025D02E69|nr:UbiA family prenyltransferase [Methanoculleus sp. UBA377]
MFNSTYRTNLVPSACQSIVHLIVYSSLYLSITGAAMVYISCFVQGLPFDPVAAVILMLIVFAVYNLNRKTDENEDAINNIERYTFTKEYGSLLFRSAVSAYIVALCLSALQGFDSFLITAVPLIAGIIYSVPLFPSWFGFRRLKEVPVMKSLVVAFSWTAPTTFLPICHASLPVDAVTGIVGIFFFFQVFINTVIFDMRDVEGDVASGVKTIPTMLGIRRTLILLTGVNLIIGTPLLLVSGFLSGPCSALLLAAGVVYAQGYLLCFPRFGTEKFFFELLTDGEFIVLGGIFYLFIRAMPYSV